MTHISFTSGEIFDIISALADRYEQHEQSNPMLANYFLNMVQQFELITEKLNELPGEKRVANLVMTL